MNDNFDYEERIDLALNSDFDSALLNCLEDDDDHENDDLAGDTSDFSHSPVRPSSPVAGAQISRLPSFLLNDSSNNMAGSASSMTGDPLVLDGPSSLEDPSPAAANKKGTTAAPSVSRGNHEMATATASAPPTTGTETQYFPNAGASAQPSQMHPLAISSSANCPPVNNHSYNMAQGGAPAMNNSMGLPSIADPQMTAALQAAFTTSFMQLSSNPAFNPALIPLAYNALAAGVDLSNFLPQFQAPAFPLAAPQESSQQLGQQPQPSHHSAPPVASVTAHAPSHLTKIPSKKPSGNSKSGIKSSKRRRSGQNSSNKRAKSGGNQSSRRHQPPFQIFDAPIELRQNFIQSQRAHGLPVLEDNNSYHFGMTVNGFHPQRSLEEPFMYKSLNAKRPLPDPVPIVDARHADAGSKRHKNAKEQKRAHRISELIDQLRVKMEKGGWKVGIKSKFHTLSSCSDYVRHLIKANEDKEAAVEKAKKDLEAKQAKMEEEKRTQQDPSEPESTTSSLTVSSRSEQADKKKAPSEYHKGQLAQRKPRHFESHESTVSSGSSEDAKPAPPSLSFGATSTVSDITDSNKGGSISKDTSMEGIRKTGEQQGSDETVSSEAAVTLKTEAGSSHRRHRDVVVAVSNKSDSVLSGAEASMTSEKTSLDSDFQLDYEEVFLKSNVPQILASTNGRIVSFNNFFLKVSGLSKNEVERLTIFSLVQTSLLSNLFEIVAAALRSTNEVEESKKDDEAAESAKGGNSDGERKLTPLKDYAAITLPCVDFPSVFRDDGSRALSSPPTRQLYMTVTLMTDNDVRKRCFHCAFTDCPGTKGALGTVTPELLSALFTNPRMATPSTEEKLDPEKGGSDDDEAEE